MASATPRGRMPSLGEEIANSVSHGVGALGALVAGPFVIAAARPGGWVTVTGASVFAAAVVTLGVLRGPWGWVLFGIVWALAALGITLKAVGGIRYPKASTALYVGMGWLALIAIRPLWLHVPAAGWFWLLAGGLAYTAGVAFYAADRLRYGHFVWHLFVLLGTTCHYCAVAWYAAG
jgi:hemolysin III